MIAPRTNRGERGVTLVEAIVALGMLSIALLGLNNLLISTIRSSEFARDVATARFLAENRLEQIKNSRYLDGNRDAYRDLADPCTDIDEVQSTVFPDENYGEVDLLNGTKFTYRSACAANPDIKQTGQAFTQGSYPAGAQGTHDYQVNHAQYNRFRREVYIVDSADYATAITNVTLGPPHYSSRDTVNLTTTNSLPASRYIKFVIVRVKWKDSHGNVHRVDLSTEKAFYIPSF